MVFFFKQKTAYEMRTRLEFRRVLFRSGEGLVLIALDRGEVDEHVLAAALGDEAEAFRRIEPFHGATNHLNAPLEAGVVETPRDAVPMRGRLRPADLAGTSEPRRDDKRKAAGSYPAARNSRSYIHSATEQIFRAGSAGGDSGYLGTRAPRGDCGLSPGRTAPCTGGGSRRPRPAHRRGRTSSRRRRRGS